VPEHAPDLVGLSGEPDQAPTAPDQPLPLEEPPASDQAPTPTARDQVPKAKEAALRLLAVRARSRSELERRLAQRGFAERDIAAALDRLSEAGLVDDAAFAAAYAESRSGRGADSRVIAAELRDRGVAPKLAERAAEAAAPVDERAERCLEVAAARLARMEGLAPEVRFRRLAAYLDRRGYPPDLIDAVLTELVPRRD
jgi:regulatory protein